MNAHDVVNGTIVLAILLVPVAIAMRGDCAGWMAKKVVKHCFNLKETK